MSTCDRICQLDVCSGEGSDPQGKLAIIFGVLGSVNGLIGILVAVLFGYLQIIEMRQFNRRQTTNDESRGQGPAAPQRPTEHLKDTETAARKGTSTNIAASQRPHDGETSNGDNRSHCSTVADRKRVRTS